jgi:hypothetical protein
MNMGTTFGPMEQLSITRKEPDMSTATKTRNASAAVADRLTETIDTALSPPDRAALAKALAAAIAEDARELEAAWGERTAAEKAVEEDEYHKKLVRRQAAKMATVAGRLTPNRRTAAASKALRESLTDEDREVLHNLELDILDEFQKIVSGDYDCRTKASTARVERANVRAAELREFLQHSCALAADVSAACSAFRRKHDIKQLPRASSSATVARAQQVWEGN